MKNKKILYLLITLVVIVIAGLVIWRVKQSDGMSENGIIYYYSEDCPHCQNVNKLLEDDKIAEKVKFEKKEVGSNVKNALEMQKRASQCNISSQNLGVPFVWNDGRCFIGETDVENFFKQEAGIQ